MEAALFSPSSLFREADDDSDGDEQMKEGESQSLSSPALVERTHAFPGMQLRVREFSFHQLNANLLWPGTFAFSEWLIQHPSLLEGHRILELGSGTGALAIFLRKSSGVDITTSDFDDKEIEENIAYNCIANEIAVLPHIRHAWGDVFPIREADWDLIIASDILLYVKQYANLVKTLCFLLKSYKCKDESACLGGSVARKSTKIAGKVVGFQPPLFVMSWRRRIGKDEGLFFTDCENAGLVVEHVGSRVYFISLGK